MVHVGLGRQQPATVRFDHTNVLRAKDVTELINAITSHPRLDVELEATAPSAAAARKRVRDAAEFVRAAAAAVRANDDARFRAGATPATERAAITVSPVSVQAFDTERPFGRLAIAAMLLILVIIAADVLFLTRTRLVSPYVRETARDRRARRSAERRERADERAIERARRKPKPKPAPQPRARRPRVAAKPLDLPNIEVHLMDKEGGLRAVELRDAAHEREERQA